MVSAEGVFPKIGNDPLYNSEVNAFNTQFIGQTSPAFVQPSLTSGTAYVSLGGSLVFTGVPFSKFINTRITLNKKASIQNVSTRLRFSGITVDFSPGSKTSDAAADETILSHDYYLTSGTLTSNGGHVGSPLVIFAEATATGNTGMVVNDFTAYAN